MEECIESIFGCLERIEDKINEDEAKLQAALNSARAAQKDAE